MMIVVQLTYFVSMQKNSFEANWLMRTKNDANSKIVCTNDLHKSSIL